MRNNKAFTLIELIIVIAIIAILAGAIFVAVDPARRLHEARNARRANDISAILDAIKTYQVDNGGEHYGGVQSATADAYYQIGTNSPNCAMSCLDIITDDNCIDLSEIGSNYLAAVPYDPTEGSEENTGYALTKDSNGAITVIACLAEGEGAGGNEIAPIIRVTR
jgi:prepilin-type N-terminal cleavage/methylation domain-containing protein